MKWRTGCLVLLLIGSPLLAQAPSVGFPAEPVAVPAPAPDEGSALAGNRNFPNFIGFISNPVQNIDPRALTQLFPLYGVTRASSSPPVPDSMLQVIGPGMYLALSERLSVGTTDGGYAFAHINHLDPAGTLNELVRARLLTNADRLNLLNTLRQQGRLANLGTGGLLPDLDRAGLLQDRRRARILRNLNQAGLLGNFDHDRDGWLNLGGFVQYTLIADAEEQFLLTAGLRFSTPAGSYSMFQGRGPVYLAPYVTVGKEFGAYHVLATAGYEFPAAAWNTTTNAFNANVHLDRQCFDWVYPLVEVNWTYHVKSVDVDLQTERGFFDLGGFTSSGNIVTLAVGVNLVLVRDRREFGAVYATPLATQRGFDFNGLLAKMVLRF